MRSMTQSSADTSNLHSPASPIPPSPSSARAVPSHIHDAPLPRDTSPPQFHPRTGSPSRHSFFTIRDSSLLLSPHSRRRVTQAIQNSLAKSTVKRYSGSIKQYIRFCDMEGIPDRLRFPADEFVLCAFAASSLGLHSRNTPRNRLAALKAWHITHNLEWKGSSRLRFVLSGVHNLAPGSSSRPPRPPVTLTMIIQLIDRLDPNSPFDLAVAACAVTAFWGQCRLGELLPPSSSVLFLSSVPTRSSFKRSVRNLLAYIIRLPHTKTHTHGQDVVLVDQRSPVNPITLLNDHLRVNNFLDDAPLFSYATPDGLSCLTKPLFLQRCNEIWHQLGYPRTTGHCFWIGGTTELLVSGTPPDVVKAMGRWSSDSFLRYWRSLDDIAPRYVRRLRTRGRGS